MSRVKRQHFVPQFYLRRFARRKGGNQVHVFDKSTGKSFVSSIKDVASRRYFYDLPELDQEVGRDQAVENFLKRYEDAAARASGGLLDSLDAGTFSGITNEQRLDLALYLPIQLLRTSESREQHVQWVTTLRKTDFFQWLEVQHPELADEFEGKFEVVADAEARKAIQLQTLLDEDLRLKLAQILLNRCWLILDGGAESGFLTSDHPVVYRGHAKHPWRSMQGLGCPMVELTLPLTPRYCLYIVDSGGASRLAQRKIERQIRPAEPENVEYYNSLQVQDSSRHLYSATGDFQIVEEMVAEDPELGNPGRSRVEVLRGDELVIREDLGV